MVRVEVQVEYTYKINCKQYSCDFSVYVKEVNTSSVEKEVNAFFTELAERNPLEGLRVVLGIKILTQTPIN